MGEVEYMVLALAMNQWIQLIHVLEELNMPVTHAEMFFDNEAGIDIA
jgi:hypothetical protein